jgi:hypothetical protein
LGKANRLSVDWANIRSAAHLDEPTSGSSLSLLKVFNDLQGCGLMEGLQAFFEKIKVDPFWVDLQ